jgi:hypothetical protein
MSGLSSTFQPQANFSSLTLSAQYSWLHILKYLHENICNKMCCKKAGATDLGIKWFRSPAITPKRQASIADYCTLMGQQALQS